MENRHKYQPQRLEVDGIELPFTVYTPSSELDADKMLEIQIFNLKQSLISKINNK